MKESITVIVPTHNDATTLPAAVESIRAQGWPDLDIIVVDDESSDDTPAVLASLAAEDLCLIRQHRGGPGSARNRGIEAARGRWIAFLDADDSWLPGKLEAQMSVLAADSAFRFAFSGALFRIGADVTQEIYRPRCGSGCIFPSLLLGPQFNLSSVVVRHDCFERIGLFDAELKTGEDWDMWLRLSAFYRGCHIPRPLIVYQVTDKLDKYPIDMYELCQKRVLDRLFSNTDIARHWPQLLARRRRLYSWHQAVLAKSHLARGRWLDFLRLATAAIHSHPSGFSFLARRWKSTRHWPNLAGLPSDEAELEPA